MLLHDSFSPSDRSMEAAVLTFVVIGVDSALLFRWRSTRFDAATLIVTYILAALVLQLVAG